jgi:hypothetical protein
MIDVTKQNFRCIGLVWCRYGFVTEIVEKKESLSKIYRRIVCRHFLFVQAHYSLVQIIYVSLLTQLGGGLSTSRLTVLVISDTLLLFLIL